MGKIEGEVQRKLLNKKRYQNTTIKPITLKTRLIPDGFRFNQIARDFFSQYFGVKQNDESFI